MVVACSDADGIDTGSSATEEPTTCTSLQLGDAVEGSRVSVVSDSALSDYEAFRRGDRFYVKIPLAEFATRRTWSPR